VSLIQYCEWLRHGGPIDLESGKYIPARSRHYTISPTSVLRLSLDVYSVMADTFDVSLLPNVLELQPKAHLMTGFGVTFLVLVWVSVATRVYVRCFMIRAFGWDDMILLMASVGFEGITSEPELTICRSHSLRFAPACWSLLGTAAVLR